MPSKFFTGLNVKESSQLMEENPAHFRKLFNYYKRTLKKRAGTFEKHNRVEVQGYKRIQESLFEAKQGYSPEALSHMSQTLSSSHTSYQAQREIDRKIVEKLNRDYGKNFIKMEELELFGRAMDLLAQTHMAQLRGSDDRARTVGAMLETARNTGMSFAEMMAEFYTEAMTE